MENASRGTNGKNSFRRLGLVLLLILAVALTALLIWRFYIAAAIVKLIFTVIFAPIRYVTSLFRGGNN